MNHVLVLRPMDLDTLIREKAAGEYLQFFGLIPMTQKCPTCEEEKELKVRVGKENDTLEFNCRKRTCGWRVSARSVSSPLLKDISRSKLPLRKLLLLIFLWTEDLDIQQITTAAKVQRKTIGRVFARCRRICYRQQELQPRLGGSDQLVMIDESLFRGAAKYNKGRRTTGDRRTTKRRFDPENDENVPGATRNYGNMATGEGWVFGLCLYRGSHQEPKPNEVRFVAVPNRKRETLVPLIRQHVDPQSIIFSDCWAAYRRLHEDGCCAFHLTVNHDEHYIDPVTQCHTNCIESVWGPGKTRILRRWRGVRPALLQFACGEMWWRSVTRQAVKSGNRRVFKRSVTAFEEFLAMAGRDFELNSACGDDDCDDDDDQLMAIAEEGDDDDDATPSVDIDSPYDDSPAAQHARRLLDALLEPEKVEPEQQPSTSEIVVITLSDDSDDEL